MDLNDNNDQDFFSFGEDTVSDVDFFKEEVAPVVTDEDGEIVPVAAGEPAAEVEEEEVVAEENLFDAIEDEDEPGEPGADAPTTTDDEPAVEAGESMSTLAFLKEKGLVEYELEEGETLTSEKAEEILEDNLDTMFENRIEELFADVPDIVKEMNKFVMKGGDINEFLDTVAVQNQTGLKEGMDMTEEANQEAVMRYGLKEEGYDEEYIKAHIEFLKDSNRLEKHSDTHFKKWDKKRKEDQAAVLASRQARLDADKASRRELKGEVTTFLKETDEITGFTVTKEDRKSLPNYMSDRTVKLENGSQITSMQRDLMRVLNSPTGSVQMAKLLKAASEDGELDFKEIKTETETKVVKKVRDNVRRKKTSIITQSVAKKRKLADYFD